MKRKTFSLCTLILIVMMFASCASKNEKMLSGKWSLASKLVGGGPSSYWFDGGSVIAPWEDRNLALKSKGVYEFIGANQLKIIMKTGYYKGNVYFFDIVKLSEDEVILRNNYQEVKFKKKK